MASVVLIEGELVYFMQWLQWVVHLGMTLYAAVEEPLLCMASEQFTLIREQKETSELW